MDPVLEQFNVMTGAEPPPEMSGHDHFPMPMLDSEYVSRQVPVLLAAGIVGAGLGLFLFKMAGFRFVFGANVGA